MADIIVNGVRVDNSYLSGGGEIAITTASGDEVEFGCLCPYSVKVEYMTVRLQMKREQLLYDIMNYAYIQHDMMEERGKSASGLDINHARHLTAEVGEDGNIDRVNRQLMLWYMDAVEALYPFTKSRPVSEEVDNELEEPEKYVFELNVPNTVSRTTIIYLSKQVHEYLVCRVIADWLSITDPASSANWQTKAEKAKTAIELTKGRYTRPQVRKISVF